MATERQEAKASMTDPSSRDFQQHLLSVIRQEAEELAQGIRSAARAARGKEEPLIMACDRLMADFARRARLRWEPEGERRVVWQEADVARHGYIDRLFNRVVVEYKPPGWLYETNEAANNRRVLRQVGDYMKALAAEEALKSPSVAGVVTDGFRLIFCRYSRGEWVEEAPVETSGASVGRLLRLLLTFHRPPLLPDPIVVGFGAQSDITVKTVRAFYEALTGTSQPLTNALYAQWEDFFADIAGLDPGRLHEKKELMTFARRVIEREAVDPARLLFALYTYSALLVKLIAVAAVTPFVDAGNPDRRGCPIDS